MHAPAIHALLMLSVLTWEQGANALVVDFEGSGEAGNCASKCGFNTRMCQHVLLRLRRWQREWRPGGSVHGCDSD